MVILKFFLHCILFSLMLEISVKHNLYLYLQLDRNINSSPLAHFRFVYVDFRDRNLRKKNENIVRTLI